MTKTPSLILAACLIAPSAPAAGPSATTAGRKAEKPPVFAPAVPDPRVGDWQADDGRGPVAQVCREPDGTYHAALLRAFNTDAAPLATLSGSVAGDEAAVTLAGPAATAKLDGSQLTCTRDGKPFTLHHVHRKSPTEGAAPPPGAVVLFDGHDLDAWAKKAGKDWLKQDGPAKWKLVDGGAMEVVPGADCLISKRPFGDCRVHLEFRTLGTPTNSGVFLQTRYEVNINETYGRTDGTPNGGLDNCTDGVRPRLRASLPPLAWQTLDIEFHAPRLDAATKVAPARATVQLNGVAIYTDQPLEAPHGAASRLGEAATGPLMLQEHGMPVQFRNIWVLPLTGP